MKLYSVCPTCEFDPKPYDSNRKWDYFDRCPKCNQIMNVWTKSGVRNERIRRGWGPALSQAHGKADL